MDNTPIITISDDQTTPKDELPISVSQPKSIGSATDIRNQIATLQQRISIIDKNAAAAKLPLQAQLAELLDLQKQIQSKLDSLPDRK